MNQASSINRTISNGVTLPSWFVIGTVAFIGGVVLGPSLLSATEAGSRYLERQVREKLK